MMVVSMPVTDRHTIHLCKKTNKGRDRIFMTNPVFLYVRIAYFFKKVLFTLAEIKECLYNNSIMAKK